MRISTTRSSSGLVELTQLGKYFNTTVGYAAILWFGGILIVYFMICYPLTHDLLSTDTLRLVDGHPHGTGENDRN